jgi:hypothetical protein
VITGAEGGVTGEKANVWLVVVVAQLKLISVIVTLYVPLWVGE